MICEIKLPTDIFSSGLPGMILLLYIQCTGGQTLDPDLAGGRLLFFRKLRGCAWSHGVIKFSKKNAAY